MGNVGARRVLSAGACRLRGHRDLIVTRALPRLRALAAPYRVLPEETVAERLGAYISALADAIEADSAAPLERFLDSADQYWAPTGMDVETALRGLHLLADVCREVVAAQPDAELAWRIERWTREAAVLTAGRGLGVMTAQLAAEVDRYRESEERLLSLQRVGGTVVSEIDLDRTLDVIVREAMRLVQGSSAAICLYDEEARVLRTIASAGAVDSLLSTDQLPLDGALTGAPVVSNDVQHDEGVSPEIRQTSRPRSPLIVPLVARDKPIGVLLVSDRERGVFSQDDRRLLGLFATQASAAIEHARLYQQARSRIAELAALQRISSVISSSLDIDQVFQAIYDEIRGVVSSDAFLIGLARPDGLFDLEFIMDGGQRYGARHGFQLSPALMQAITQRRPVIIGDNHAGHVPRMHTVGHPETRVRAIIAAPLLRGERVVGLISAQSYTPHIYQESDAQLLMTIANQAVVAIEHARLYGQAQTLAIAEERNRLAREIHDTLAQGLIGIALYLERIELSLPPDDETNRRLIRRALSLTRGNLEEARRSVRDLRAAPLEGRTLVEALQHLSGELRGESQFAVDLAAPPSLPLLAARVEIALFRMVQEAVTNCRKHAQCGTLTITLELAEDFLRVEVRDDGRGFDPIRAMSEPSRFGLASMRERITQIGGAFEVESAPGEGTAVRALIPLWRALASEQGMES